MLITTVARQLLRGVRDRRRVDPGVRILTYHGIVEHRKDPLVEASFHLASDFRSHVAVLRHCRVISIDELGHALRERHRRPCVLITFDDGFRNNLLAAELLAAARLPATVFVAAGNIDTREPIWPTLLRLLLVRGSARSIDLAGVRYDLDRDDGAFARVRTVLKTVPTAKRLALWTELLAHLRSGELDELVSQFPSIAMMSWDDVRSLLAMGIGIGSHGLAHELHHAAQPDELRHAELAGSKARIEEATSRPCTAFAFPNGTVSPDSSREVRACGYAFGLTMISRAATATDDSMLLPRIMPGAGVEKLISALVFGN